LTSSRPDQTNAGTKKERATAGEVITKKTRTDRAERRDLIPIREVIQKNPQGRKISGVYEGTREGGHVPATLESRSAAQKPAFRCQKTSNQKGLTGSPRHRALRRQRRGGSSHERPTRTPKISPENEPLLKKHARDLADKKIYKKRPDFQRRRLTKKPKENVNGTTRDSLG